MNYPPRLPATALYVTHEAALEYAHACGLELEAARRDLTTRLCGAGLSGENEPYKAHRYRRRSNSSRLDIQAHVLDEPPLLVVVAVHVRTYTPRRGGQK